MPERREFSAEERRTLAKRGAALPDGSFPIVTVADLRNAIAAFGRAKNKAAAKRHIIKRARALGRTDLLPEGWRTGRMQMEDRRHSGFKLRLSDVSEAQAQLDGGAKVGEARVMVAAFDVPDSAPAHGNGGKRQVIDRGAFKEFVSKRDFAQDPVPFFLDHGAYTVQGFSSSALMVGRAEDFREAEDGLEFQGFWNLEKQVAREAFSDIVFTPQMWQFSFRNLARDETVRAGEDGYEHITSFKNIVEVSQLPFGAQNRTHVRPGSVKSRAADIAEVSAWMSEDPEFASALRELVGSTETEAEPDQGVVDLAEPPDPGLAIPDTFGWLKDESSRADTIKSLKVDSETREALHHVLEEAERPDAVAEFLAQLWQARR